MRSNISTVDSRSNPAICERSKKKASARSGSRWPARQGTRSIARGRTTAMFLSGFRTIRKRGRSQGRVDKDAWTVAWQRQDYSPEKMREEAAIEMRLLRAAVESYATAFRANPGNYYAGINALTLMHLPPSHRRHALRRAGRDHGGARCDSRPPGPPEARQ